MLSAEKRISLNSIRIKDTNKGVKNILLFIFKKKFLQQELLLILNIL